MILLQGAGILIFFIIVPVIIGDLIRNFANIEKSIVTDYVLGMTAMWGLFQFWAVPLILLKCPFRLLVILWGGSLGILIILQGIFVWRNRSVYKEYLAAFITRRWKIDKNSLIFMALTAVMCVLILQQCVVYIGYTHLDQDDSRFVATALDAQEKDKMFLYNPMTGEYVGHWMGDLPKDVASPWSIYMAAVATLTGTHVTIMAHTILPVFLLLTAYGAYWLIAGVFFGKNKWNKAMFVIFILLLNNFFAPSVYTESVFLLTRIWQGKAVVAGVMLPVVLFALLYAFKNKNDNRQYFILFLGMCGICLMSGMGIMLGAVFVGVFGGVFSIINKDWRMLLKLGGVCFPNVIYGLIYFGLK